MTIHSSNKFAKYLTPNDGSEAETKFGKKPKLEFNPETDGEALESYMEEALISKEKITAEQEHLGDIKTAAKEALGIKPAVFNKLLTMRFKRNRDEVETENDELIDLYDKVFPKK